jgi:uncharacterized membrane protein YbhN (UPF0104 family)
MKNTFYKENFEPHIRLRKWFYRIVFWTLALFLLFALLKKSDWQYTFAKVSEIPATVILCCTLGWFASFIFRAIRFQIEWQSVGVISFFSSLRLTFLHNAAVLLVPFRVGELGYPALVQQLLNVSWQQCIRSLLWLRLQDGLVLLSVAFLMLPFFVAELRVALMLLVILMLVFTKSKWLHLLKSRNFVAQQLRAFLHQRGNAWTWFWSMANWAVKILVVAVMLQTLTGLSMYQTLNGALTGELSALLPINGPAGLGTYEAGVWFGLALPWSEMKNLMACILFSHLFFLGISLLGAGVFLVLDVFQFFSPKLNQEDAHG